MQLKTHASRLDVPVFEKGYNKDAASIALEAVKYAKQTAFDVVLVDTAGRMQVAMRTSYMGVCVRLIWVYV